MVNLIHASLVPRHRCPGHANRFAVTGTAGYPGSEAHAPARKKNVTVLRALYRAHDDTNSQRNQIQPTRDRSCAVRRGVVHAKGVPVPANGGDDIDGTTGGPCRNES